MGRESTLAWATRQMAVPFTAIVNTSKGSSGGKEGQLMSSVLLVMESELLSDKPVKKKSWTCTDGVHPKKQVRKFKGYEQNENRISL